MFGIPCSQVARQHKVAPQHPCSSSIAFSLPGSPDSRHSPAIPKTRRKTAIDPVWCAVLAIHREQFLLRQKKPTNQAWALRLFKSFRFEVVASLGFSQKARTVVRADKQQVRANLVQLQVCLG